MTTSTLDKIQSEVKPIRWDLSDLFSGLKDPKIEAIFTEIPTRAKAFSDAYKGTIASISPETLLTAFQEKEAMGDALSRLGQFIYLTYSTDTSCDEVKALRARMETVSSSVANETLFFGLELGCLTQERIDVLTSSECLKPYWYNLKRAKELSTYQLSEKEEQLSNLKDLSGTRAFTKLYTELTSAFQFEFTVDGQTKTMNGSELRALRQHEDAGVRREAMSLFFKRYEENSLTISSIFNSILRDYNTELVLRGYSSPVGVMNKSHDLSDKAVDLLHEVTTESYPLVQRYYKLKAKLLGLKELSLSDIYAPLPDASKTYTWEEAKTLVLDSFKAFDSTFYEGAKRMFDENRIDVPVMPTKKGGAYCYSSSPDLDPYVMLNYLGRPRDVSTLAHELGHAIHAMFSSDLPISNYHAILPLCETASVFSEMLLTDHLRAIETDKNAKVSLISETLENLFATSHRQNMFSSFEMAIHEKINAGMVSSSEFCELYRAELKKMFGDAVVCPDSYNWEWSSIPHMVDCPFYVYSYNFGNLLVIALYQTYLEQGDAFVPKIREALSLGSSVSPIAITKALGVDIESKAFWKQSLTFIESLVDELEQLTT
ncbi:peptidase M3 [Candidatus Marinamargulisbacteria bacterium SCGC AG-439-L15]|nr:peptidase M3 [Candidatus Marinamargulisbacteria bacterium SCGC AG-439-L15]